MLKNSIVKAAAKNDVKKVKEVKHVINSEKSKRSWSMIGVTVDEPRMPSITETGREKHGK